MVGDGHHATAGNSFGMYATHENGAKGPVGLLRSQYTEV